MCGLLEILSEFSFDFGNQLFGRQVHRISPTKNLDPLRMD
jgi:hypothetical protein